MLLGGPVGRDVTCRAVPRKSGPSYAKKMRAKGTRAVPRKKPNQEKSKPCNEVIPYYNRFEANWDLYVGGPFGAHVYLCEILINLMYS